MLLAERLSVPEGTAALLLDMDGVMLDTLALDYELVNELLRPHMSPGMHIARATIKEHFAYAIPDFWARIGAAAGLDLGDADLVSLCGAHEEARRTRQLPVCEGIGEILEAARTARLKVAVVSNNPEAEVEKLLVGAGLRTWVDEVVGNDAPGLRKKPAPDAYLEAARRLGLPPSGCVAIEDSLLGAEAAHLAGCHTVGVSTGGDSFDELAGSPFIDRCHTHFGVARVRLGRQGVTTKSLITPNEFVSHMIEHIAWRLGCSIDLLWTSDDWHQLGVELGREVGRIPRTLTSAAALGMIDDGSCEVEVRVCDRGGATVGAVSQVDLDWFVNLRVEQLRDGGPLVALLNGLGAGAGIELRATVVSLEDPHHTWEGVFRAVGIALDRLCATPAEAGRPAAVAPPMAGQPATSGQRGQRSTPAAERPVERGWRIEHASTTRATVSRRTAESVVTVDVALGGSGTSCDFRVADSIHVEGMSDLLTAFADAAGLRLDVVFSATSLNSSHVVTEDIGMVLGRALRAVAIERMTATGIQGAGSNVDTVETLRSCPVRVGISLEGRKFCKFVPVDRDYETFRRAFLIGHTLSNGLYSEDLDDFVDALAGGLNASIMVHVDGGVDATAGWPLLFEALGSATAELFAVNPARKELVPGVKGTLA